MTIPFLTGFKTPYILLSGGFELESLSSDNTYTGSCLSGVLGGTISFGDLCYYKASDQKWYLCDASSISTSGDVLLGICLDSGVLDDSTTILLYGRVRSDSSFPTLPIGVPIYASETAGDITNIKPTTTDSVIRRIGFSLSSDEILFCPSPDFFTLF